MLIRFSAENFRYFKEKQELTSIGTSLKDLPEALISVEGFPLPLLRVAGVYGANASGKTNVLKALAFIRHAVHNSHRKWEPDGKIDHEAFRLNDSEDKPSTFQVEFFLKNVRYRYGFTLDSEQILEEWLHAYPQGKQQVWFTRNEGKRFSYSRNLSGENRAIETLTRRNSLFLSAAAQNNHEALLPIYNCFVKNITFVFSPRLPSPLIEDPSQLCRDEKHKTLLMQLLTAAE